MDPFLPRQTEHRPAGGTAAVHRHPAIPYTVIYKTKEVPNGGPRLQKPLVFPVPLIDVPGKHPKAGIDKRRPGQKQKAPFPREHIGRLKNDPKKKQCII